MSEPKTAEVKGRERDLQEALVMALEWIDAVPQETPLPVMPGFDRDWVNGIIRPASPPAETGEGFLKAMAELTAAARELQARLKLEPKMQGREWVGVGIRFTNAINAAQLVLTSKGRGDCGLRGAARMLLDNINEFGAVTDGEFVDALEDALSAQPVSPSEGEVVAWLWVKGSYPLCGKEIFAKTTTGLGEWPENDEVEIVPLYTHPASDQSDTERMREAAFREGYEIGTCDGQALDAINDPDAAWASYAALAEKAADQ